MTTTYQGTLFDFPKQCLINVKTPPDLSKGWRSNYSRWLWVSPFDLLAGEAFLIVGLGRFHSFDRDMGLTTSKGRALYRL